MLKLSVPISLTTINDKTLSVYLDYVKKCDAKRVFLCGVKEIYMDDSLIWTEPEKIKNTIKAFRESGVEVGIWINALGHGGVLVGAQACSLGEKYTSIEGVNGGKSAHGFCPADDNFIKDYAKGIERIASLDPDIIMLDDDFRIGGRSGYYFGCFCPKHLAWFYELVGEEIPRNEIEAKIYTGGKNKYRDAYRQMIRETMIGFAKHMRAAVDSVDPKIRLGVSGTQEHWDVDGLHLPELARAFAGSTEPFFRTDGAPYWSIDIMKIIDRTRCYNKWLSDEGIDDLMAEGDTYPRPRYNVPFKTLELFNYALIADEYSKGMLGYIFEYNATPEYESGYVEKYIARLPLFRAVDEIFNGKKTVGVTVINEMHKTENWELPQKLYQGIAGKISIATNPSSINILAKNSIPTSWNENGYPSLITGENARKLNKESLKNGAILDITAAKILSEKGIDVGLVSAEKISAAGEYYVNYDSQIPSIDGGALYGIECKEGSRVLSKFVPSELLASYLYENAEKQRFYIIGFDSFFHNGSANMVNGNPMSNYLNNYYRQEEMIEAIEWMCGKPLPAKSKKNPNLYIYAAKDEEAMSVLLLNIHLDSIDEPVVELDKDYKEIKCVNCTGRIEGNKVYLSEISSYGMAAFEVRCNQITNN